MSAVNLIQIISGINQLLGLLKTEGIGWSDLRARIDKATAEGRQFDMTDIALLQAKDDAERALLDAAIVKARGKGTL
jgi:3-methyladenine DNA glycosylase Tag